MNSIPYSQTSAIKLALRLIGVELSLLNIKEKLS
jgi:hypothetical protein